MAILALIVLFNLLGGAAGQPNSRSVLLSTSSLSKVVVSRSTGDVFLADQDTVYLLPGDLSEITSNVSRTAGQTPEGMTLSKQDDKLIVCWASSVPSGGETINDAPCAVYNSTYLLQTLQEVPGDSLPVGAARGNPYLVSQGFGGGEGETFYVMSADDRRLYHRKYRISDGARAVETPLFSAIADRRYVSGATVGNFSYFATMTIEGNAVLRVVRVCDIEPTLGAPDMLWDNWYEIQVFCGTPQESVQSSTIELVSAHFLFAVDEPLLVLSAVIDAENVSVCAVPLSTIDVSARNMFKFCANNDIHPPELQFPWTNVGMCVTEVSSTPSAQCVYFNQSTPLLSTGKNNRV